MTKKTIKAIQRQKGRKKITCLTAYTSSVAKIIDNYVDIVLVGDSLGSTIYGMKNTQKVSLEMMKEHGRAVSQYCKKSYTIIDMPFNTYNNNKEALTNAKNIINYTKCQSVKIESDENNIGIVKYLTKNKIKVVSHIGVTPQKYKNFNKIRTVGKLPNEKEEIIKLALNLEKAGSCLIVLECMQETLAREISKKLKIPTIGIGASKDCDGQILVIDDILGISSSEKKPKFVKSYANFESEINKSVKKYCLDVIQKKFPNKKNVYK